VESSSGKECSSAVDLVDVKTYSKKPDNPASIFLKITEDSGITLNEAQLKYFKEFENYASEMVES
jgi:hypothetical protein